MKPKTIFLLLILFFVSASDSFAQRKIWLQASAEIKHSMGGDYFVPADILAETYDWQRMQTALTPKITLSAEAKYDFNERMGVSAGIAFAMRGHGYSDYVWNYSGFTVEYKRKVSLNYLEVPIQFHYTHTPVKKISFIAAVGGYAGLLVSYKDENKAFFYDGTRVIATAEDKTYTTSVASGTTTQTESVTLTEEPFNTYDYGAMLGIGIRIVLSGKTHLSILPQYQLGFTDIKNKTSTATIQNQTVLYWQDVVGYTPNLEEDYVNSSIGLKIGLRFGL